MAPAKRAELSASTLTPTILELIERCSWDIPADVDKALLAAVQAEESGTNGRSALEAAVHAADRARAEKVPVGSDPISVLLTVDAPADTVRAPFEEALAAATQEAAKSGLIRTPFIDAATGKPRRGKDLGPIARIRFRDSNGPIQLHLWIRGMAEAGQTRVLSLPHPQIDGGASLESAVRAAVYAIYEAQGLVAGPGVIGVQIGADALAGVEGAIDQILRPIGSKNPSKPLVPLEARLLAEANQLGVGPQGLGGQTTILAAHIGAADAPIDRKSITVIATSWALRRHTVTLADDGSIGSWDSTLAAKKVREPGEFGGAPPVEEPAEDEADEKAPTKKTAKKTAKKATKKTAAAPKKTAKKTTKKSKK